MRTSKCRGPCPSCGGSGTKPKRRLPPWWAENSKEAYSSGLDGLARALKNWTDHRSGRRRGRRMGFPRPKRKGHCRDACRFTTGQIKVFPDRRHIQLPRIGVLKTHESTRKLARRLEQGTARIIAATISRQADRWFVSFTVEVQRHIPTGNGKAGVVGVDVGVRHLAVLSTVWWFPIPMRSNGLCARCGGSTGNFIAASWALAVAARPDGGSRGSMPGPGWSEIATWPVPWPMPAWPNCAASSATRPTGMVADSSSPTPSIPRPRRARPVAG